MAEIMTDVCRITLCFIRHVRLDAKKLWKAVVIDEQPFIQFFAAHEHNLEVKGQRVGAEPLGPDGGVRCFAGIFNARLIRAQGT